MFEQPSSESESKLKAKTEDMKLEIAKIDSILQGNLLLEKSSHKISDMLLLDKFKSRFPLKQEYFSPLESKLESEGFEASNLQILNSNAITSDSNIDRPINKLPALSRTELSCENGNSSPDEEIDVVTVEKCSITSQEKQFAKFIVSSEESIASNASNEGCASGLSNESCDLSNKGIKLSNRRRLKASEETLVSQEGLDSLVESIEDVDKEFIDCKWKGCGEKLEVQHLLEHLTVKHI